MREMRYATVCSGIEAPTVAWCPLGWRAAWFSEIEPFCCRLLAAKYDTPNLGDMTKIGESDAKRHGPIDVLMGGTPCQSFSVAGLRRGLDDPRGNLALRFCQLAGVLLPRWLVWENVPGVLSSGEGRDFGSFLGALAKLGYGFAYRVLDAQFVRVESHSRAVPQRRRRVFVIGYLGDWRRAAAVLLERQSLSGHPPPRREAGQGIAAGLTRGADSGGRCGYAGRRREDDINIVPAIAKACRTMSGGVDREDGHTLIAHALSAEGFDASEDGTGRGIPLVSATLDSHYADKWGLDNQHVDAGCPNFVPIAMRYLGNAEGGAEGIPYLTCASIEGISNQTPLLATYSMGIRRLTPLECERLMGFPDGYTKLDPQTKDGPRYRALGNSIAVNVLNWIGQRIAAVDELGGCHA